MPDARARIKAIRARGGTVTVIDPRRTETARIADQHVSVRPGGDTALLLAMLHVIAAAGLDRAPHWVEGVDDVRALVADWTPEVAEAAAGVDAATIRALEGLYLGNDVVTAIDSAILAGGRSSSTV